MYNSGCSYDLDVVMSYLFSQDTVRQAALEEGFAAVRREERKIIKYEKNSNFLAIHQASISLLWYLNVLELGGSEATNYLNKLAPEDHETLNCANEADFRDFWRKNSR